MIECQFANQVLELDCETSDDSSSFEAKKKSEDNFRVWFIRDIRKKVYGYSKDEGGEEPHSESFMRLKSGVLSKSAVELEENKESP